MTWTLNLPMLPMSFNEQRTAHWAKRSRERKQIESALGWLAKEQRVPFATAKRAVTVTIHKGPRSRIKDDEPNLDARAKALLDAMVNIGLLIDDSPDWLLWTPVVEGEKRAEKQTVITLRDVDPIQ